GAETISLAVTASSGPGVASSTKTPIFGRLHADRNIRKVTRNIPPTRALERVFMFYPHGVVSLRRQRERACMAKRRITRSLHAFCRRFRCNEKPGRPILQLHFRRPGGRAFLFAAVWPPGALRALQQIRLRFFPGRNFLTII